MVNVKGHYISPFPIFYPNRYKASLSKIEAMQPESLLLAHGGEVQLDHQQYLHLAASAPEKPATHWRSVKTKLLKAF